MCGLTGLYAFSPVGYFYSINVNKALATLAHRGPDSFGYYSEGMFTLGHRRLSVIDTSPAARQPMKSADGRYLIAFNGELFNYRSLRASMEAKGVQFQTESDTEVLLQGLIREGEAFLNRMQGFFAFAFYDQVEASLLLARDRFGIKPMAYFLDGDKCIFGSEVTAVAAYGIPREVDAERLALYLRFNYQPEPGTMMEGIRKLPPGHLLRVSPQSVKEERWYHPSRPHFHGEAYEAACTRLRDLLESAVEKRLVADVPLGSFLSGGIDSSIITGLAAAARPGIHSFSVGFSEDPYYDETSYAQLVAKHFQTQHTVYSLSRKDLLDEVEGMLSMLDEPFADSSALAVYVLSKRARKEVTVALSGDGADEYFGGYQKHLAEWGAQHIGFKELGISALLPLFKLFPQGRALPMSNLFRRLIRYGEGLGMEDRERYLFWASISKPEQVLALLSPALREQLSSKELNTSLMPLLGDLGKEKGMNEVFQADMNFVLPGDMLVKADRMSMAHGLELRVPFLDHELVEYVQSLPEHWKVDGRMRKKILQDAFRDFLPAALYNRPKKGFEIPLQSWLRKELRPMVEAATEPTLIQRQGLFDPAGVSLLKRKLYGWNPGDAPARVWALLVFQYWWKKQVDGRQNQ